MAKYYYDVYDGVEKIASQVTKGEIEEQFHESEMRMNNYIQKHMKLQDRYIVVKAGEPVRKELYERPKKQANLRSMFTPTMLEEWRVMNRRYGTCNKKEG